MREGSFFKEQVGEEMTLQPPCSADRMRDSQVVESDCVATAERWTGQARRWGLGYLDNLVITGDWIAMSVCVIRQLCHDPR